MAPPKRKLPLFAISIFLYLIVIVGLVLTVLYVRKKLTNITTNELNIGKWVIQEDPTNDSALKFCFKDDTGKYQQSHFFKWDKVNLGQLWINNVRYRIPTTGLGKPNITANWDSKC